MNTCLSILFLAGLFSISGIMQLQADVEAPGSVYLIVGDYTSGIVILCIAGSLLYAINEYGKRQVLNTLKCVFVGTAAGYLCNYLAYRKVFSWIGAASEVPFFGKLTSAAIVGGCISGLLAYR